VNSSLNRSSPPDAQLIPTLLYVGCAGSDLEPVASLTIAIGAIAALRDDALETYAAATRNRSISPCLYSTMKMPLTGRVSLSPHAGGALSKLPGEEGSAEFHKAYNEHLWRGASRERTGDITDLQETPILSG
jgi:hypothetical protein